MLWKAVFQVIKNYSLANFLTELFALEDSSHNVIESTRFDQEYNVDLKSYKRLKTK